MRRIELTWDDGEWDEGVFDQVMEAILDGLNNAKIVLPDSTQIVRGDEEQPTLRERCLGDEGER